MESLKFGEQFGNNQLYNLSETQGNTEFNRKPVRKNSVSVNAIVKTDDSHCFPDFPKSNTIADRHIKLNEESQVQSDKNEIGPIRLCWATGDDSKAVLKSPDVRNIPVPEVLLSHIKRHFDDENITITCNDNLVTVLFNKGARAILFDNEKSDVYPREGEELLLNEFECFAYSLFDNEHCQHSILEFMLNNKLLPSFSYTLSPSYTLDISFKQAQVYQYFLNSEQDEMPVFANKFQGKSIACLNIGYPETVLIGDDIEFIYTGAIAPCISLVLFSQSKRLTLFTHLFGCDYSGERMEKLFECCRNHEMNDVEATIIGGWMKYLDIGGGYCQLRRSLYDNAIPVRHEFIGDPKLTGRPSGYFFRTRTGTPYRGPDRKEALAEELKLFGIDVSFHRKIEGKYDSLISYLTTSV